MADLINWNITVRPLPGSFLSIPTYGNYGGPGYGGGKLLGSGGQADYSIPPRDALDALFRTHDQAYGAVYDRNPGKPVSAFSQADLNALAMADKAVLEAMKTLPPETWNSNDARAFAGAMTLAFVKSNIESTYHAGSILSAAEKDAYMAFATKSLATGIGGMMAYSDNILDDYIDKASFAGFLGYSVAALGIDAGKAVLTEVYGAIVDAAVSAAQAGEYLARLSAQMIKDGVVKLEDMVDTIVDVAVRTGRTIADTLEMIKQAGLELVDQGVATIKQFADLVKDAGIEFGTALEELVSGFIDDIKSLFETAQETRSPLVLDLDGDGIATVSKDKGVHFDNDGNGFAETTGWVNGKDGLLAIDRNGNGTIDDGTELFGNYSRLANGKQAANGFEALAELDGNNDGKIDSADAGYAQLRVWKDVNGDGRTDAGELMTLQQAGVKSIGVSYKAGAVVDAQGNQHLQVGTYVTSAGATRDVHDIWFGVDVAHSEERDLVAVSAAIAALPDIKGFGNVHSLHQAMARDTTGHLENLVKQFVAAKDVESRDAIVIDLIYAWAGVEAVDPDSRAATQIYGNVIGDARKLETLEEFLGEEYLGIWCWGTRDPNPHGPASKILLSAFNQLVQYITAQLDIQSTYKALYDSIRFSWDAGKNAFVVDVSQTVPLLKAMYAPDPQLGIEVLGDFASTLKFTGDLGNGIVQALRAQGTTGAAGFPGALAQFGLASTLGDSGNNHLNGSDAANDYMLGRAGDDDLYGGAGNDTLDGGTGNDYLVGGDGADVYVFGKGYGQDIIHNFDADAVGTKQDKVTFGPGIAPAAVVVARSGYDLVLTVAGTSDRLTIFSYFDTDGAGKYAVETIQFADGTVWDVATVKAKALVGTGWDDAISGYASADVLEGRDGNDTLHGMQGDDTLAGGNGQDSLFGDEGDDAINGDAGSDNLAGGAGADKLAGGTGDDSLSGEAGADRLDGGAGRDYLVGGDGADVYLFGKGGGQDTIWNFDSDVQGTNADKIVLGAGIAASGVTLLRQNGDLILKINGTDDQLTVQGYFASDATSSSTVETIEFADGTVWSVADVMKKVLVGSAGSDVIGGYASADSLSGLDGNDAIHGGGGADTLQGGNGVDTLFGDDGDDVVSGDAGADTLYGGQDDDRLSGGTGDDSLSGETGDDRLDGGAGRDMLYGGDGADVYVFGKGYGQDTVNNYDNDLQGTSADKVLLGAGIAPAGVTLLRAGADLVLRINGTDDQLTVQGYFNREGTSNAAVETIEFADGTVWDVAAVKTRVLVGTAGSDGIDGYAGADSLTGLDGNDTIRGGGGADKLQGGNGADVLYGDHGADTINGDAGTDTLYGGEDDDTLSGGAGDDSLSGNDGADRLDGGAGRDALAGGDGADVYLFGKGYGQDTIYNADNDLQGADADKVLLGAGVTPAGVTVLRSSDDLLIRINGTDDQLTVQGYFGRDATTSAAVETIEFADGTVWDVAAVMTKVLVGTPGTDTINGYTSDDQLTGLDGNDTIRGGEGDDALFGGNGIDTLYGGQDNDTLNGDAGDDTLYGGDNNDVLLGGTGDDNLSGESGADRLDGGAGNDRLGGGDGADVYLFGKGSGQDTVYNYDNDIQGTKADKVLLGAGVTAAGVTVLRVSSDLVLRINGTDDQLTIQSYFSGDGMTGNAVETIQFADGTVWNVAAVKTRVLAATAGSDTIDGYASADRLEGQDGNDTIRGAKGNDTIDGGNGRDALYGDDGNDVIDGGAGADSLGGGTGNDTLLGGAGDDSLAGNAGADRLDGGAGRDVLAGGDGADVYVFGKGYGQDTIANDDNDIPGTNADKVLLGTGLAPAGVTLLRAGNDLVLTIAGTDDQLTIQRYFDNDATTGTAVETIEFADGTVWDVATVMTKVLAGSADGDTIDGYTSADRLSGLDGNDTIRGAKGNDTLGGGNGRDTLYGNEGNDTLAGDAGADTLYGGANNDTLAGGAGDDTLFGETGADRLDGGAGRDLLYGGDGADVYVFGKGYGQDTVNNHDNDVQGTNADKVLFGAGVAPAGVTVLRSNNDLVLRIDGSDDQLTIQRYFDGEGTTAAAVETIQFADGTVWDVAAVKAKISAPANIAPLVLYGSSANDVLKGGLGNDTLYGQTGNDRLDGGAGNDQLDGGAGNDTYAFGIGSGKDIIASYESAAAKVDVVQLGAGVTAANLTLARDGSDLVLGIGTSADQLRISNYFHAEAAGGYQVEQIKFADGTVWNVATVKAKVLAATAEDDARTGYATADTLSGLGGNDSLYGQAGNDVIDGGTGDDNLYGEDGDDQLRGGTQDDRLDGGNGNDTLLGQDGSDVLYGQYGNDKLDGGAGGDYLDGGAGNDTYVFGIGYGKDTIGSYDGTAGKLDVVQLGAGVTAANLLATRENMDLVLTIGGTSDQLRISNYFQGDGAGGYQVEQIKFADGTIWNVAMVKTKVLVATAEDDVRTGYATADALSGLGGDDNLYGREGNDILDGGTGVDNLYGDDGDDQVKGGAQDDRLDGGNGNDTLLGQDDNDTLSGQGGNDRLDGGAGNDYLDGGAGNDTYVFGIGSGKDTIASYDYAGGKIDVVEIGAGIAPASLLATRDNMDLVLAISGRSDQLRISNYFSNDGAGGYQVEQIKFADGTIWNVATVKTKVLGATAEDNIRTGYATADTLSGLGGNDTLYGRDGNDVLDGGTGADNLYGEEGDDQIKGGAQDDRLDGGNGNDTLLGQDDNDSLSGQYGNDRLDGGAGSDQLDGGAGNDTYVFGIGYGKDTIASYDGTAGKLDVVEIGAGVVPANLLATRENADLLLTISGRSDQLRISGYFYGDGTGGYQVEQIKFADGTIWNVATVKAKVLAGTAEDDVRMGYATADTLSGLGGNDTLYGREGNDILDGGTGADNLYGEDGDDQVKGGAQDDRLEGGNGNDTLLGQDDNDTLSGQSGNDRLDGGAGSDYLDGGIGNDTYVFGIGYGKDTIASYDGTAGKLDVVQLGAGVTAANLLATRDNADLVLTIGGTSDQLRISNYFHGDAAGGYQVEQIRFADGSSWNVAAVKTRVLAGTAEDDVRMGYATADTLSGLGGNDTLYGREGNDILDGGTGADNLYGEDGDDQVKGGAQDDRLDGGNGNDTLLGQDDNDTLSGQSGNDRLDGGTGSDYLDGGSGNDTYVFGIGSGKDTISSYDGTAGKLDVVEIGAGVTAANLLATRDNMDLLLTVGGRSDQLRVNSYFSGDAAAGYQVEQVKFADGTVWNVADVKGRVLGATAEDDVRTGYATADKLSGLGGNDTLYGREGNDVLDGGSGTDRLYGEDGDDTLQGGAQADYMEGGAGNDTYVVDDAGDVVAEANGGGIDKVQSSITHALNANVENLTLTGTAAAKATGNALANVIVGNGGDNIIVGGDGADTLTGGAGSDVFDFNALSESGIVSATRDVITDFVRGADKIDLSTIDADSSTAANNAFSGFIAATDAFTKAGQLRFTGGVLYGNTDADSDAEFAIQLVGVTALTAADIVL